MKMYCGHQLSFFLHVFIASDVVLRFPAQIENSPSIISFNLRKGVHWAQRNTLYVIKLDRIYRNGKLTVANPDIFKFPHSSEGYRPSTAGQLKQILITLRLRNV